MYIYLDDKDIDNVKQLLKINNIEHTLYQDETIINNYRTLERAFSMIIEDGHYTQESKEKIENRKEEMFAIIIEQQDDYLSEDNMIYLRNLLQGKIINLLLYDKI